MPSSTEETVDALSVPLKDLPAVDFAFAYGSAVFPQQRGDSQNAPQTDYIVAVESPAAWHAENLLRNPRHYALWLRRMGGATIASLADNVGVGVHFNTLVPWQDRVIKYGVIGRERLVSDLRRWDSLYVSGRMQKAVRVLVPDQDIVAGNEANLQSALAAALLLMPEEVEEGELYRQICGLSYRGDIRMLFAEDRFKVDKIVDGSFCYLRSLYAPLIQQWVERGQLAAGEEILGWRQDLSAAAQQALLACLPPGLVGPSSAQVARWPRAKMQVAVRRAAARIVQTASARQAVSGIITTGGVNAARYVGRKVRKWWTATR